MTAILGSWDVSACKNFKATFQGAANFSAVGIDAWNISSAEKMNYIFDGASAITSCSKRMIADEWTKIGETFATVTTEASIPTTYAEAWKDYVCVCGEGTQRSNTKGCEPCSAGKYV
jgi:hypothetical protein